MLLIAGIDPGTTTGIVALDLTGSLVASLSKKGLGQPGIVREIERLGSPILIASDRSPPPAKVAKVAAAFSARLVWPEHPLSRAQKMQMFRAYFRKQGLPTSTWSRHQKDSLVAALFAWKAFRPLIAKIDKRLEQYKGQPYFDRIEQYVQAEVILKGRNLESAIKDFSENINHA